MIQERRTLRHNHKMSEPLGCMKGSGNWPKWITQACDSLVCEHLWGCYWRQINAYYRSLLTHLLRRRPVKWQGSDVETTVSLLKGRGISAFTTKRPPHAESQTTSKTALRTPSIPIRLRQNMVSTAYYSRCPLADRTQGVWLSAITSLLHLVSPCFFTHLHKHIASQSWQAIIVVKWGQYGTPLIAKLSTNSAAASLNEDALSIKDHPPELSSDGADSTLMGWEK